MGYRSPHWFTVTFEEYLLNNDSLVVDLSALFSVFCFLFSASVVQSWDWQRRGKQAKESWVPRCCLLTGLEMLSISSSVFQWPLICSLWVLVPNHLSAKMIKNSGGAMDPIAASTVKLELIVRSSWKPGWRPTRHRHEGSDLRTVEIIWREITCLKS